MSTIPSFPVGSSVILQNLVKGAQYNGIKGTIKSPLHPTTLRQEVIVAEAKKILAIKPENLRYEPRDISSLGFEEATNLILHSKVQKPEELAELMNEKRVDTDGLRKMVADNVSTCPDELAAMLAKISFGDDSFAARLSAAPKEGWEYQNKQNKLSPDEFLKKQYRQTSKNDEVEESKLSCQACGKTDAKLSKCGRCLSAWYCSSECQKQDYSKHKIECKKLLKQRLVAVQNPCDISGGGRPIIPYIGIALSESITGVHGEVLCDVPQWDLEEASDLKRYRPNINVSKVTRAIKYFFKTYQSSVTAAKNLSVSDVGGMCQDAIILYSLNYPGVRKVDPEEGMSGRDTFTLAFTNLSSPPKNWKLKAEDVAHLPPEVIAAFEKGIEQMRNDKRFANRG